MRKELGMLLLLGVLCVAVFGVEGFQRGFGQAVGKPVFLGTTNLTNMARLVGMYGIFSIGLGIVIIAGGIDLSVGSLLALLGVILVYMLVDWGWPWPFAVLALVLLAMLFGAVHGVLVTRAGIQPFIVTLCGLLVYRGLAQFVADDATKGFGTAKGFEALRDMANGSLAGVPMPFVVLVAIGAVMWLVLHRTVCGRYLFAVGRNEEASRYSGINTQWVIASSYIVSGGLAGVSAILIAFYTNSIAPASHGSFHELYGIAAAVLGGCSLRGGEGSVVGIIIGTALLQVLQNLVNLLGIPSSLNFAVMGAVILVGVLVDQILVQRRGAGKGQRGFRSAKDPRDPKDPRNAKDGAKRT
jgi:ribose transport system permease protein